MLQRFECILPRTREEMAPHLGPDATKVVLEDECEGVSWFDPADVRYVFDWFPDDEAEVPRFGCCDVQMNDGNSQFIVKLPTDKMAAIVNAAKAEAQAKAVLYRAQ